MNKKPLFKKTNRFYTVLVGLGMALAGAGGLAAGLGLDGRFTGFGPGLVAR